MINIIELEEKILKVLGIKKYITPDTLVDKITLYELIHLIVLDSEFTKIKIVNVKLNEKMIFSDNKYDVVSVPYFEIKRKEQD